MKHIYGVVHMCNVFHLFPMFLHFSLFLYLYVYVFVCACMYVVFVPYLVMHMPSFFTQHNGNLEAIEFPKLEHIGECLNIVVSMNIVNKRE